MLSEAWLMSQRLESTGDLLMDLTKASCQEKLLSHLYQELVRYTELNVRHAVRLDHSLQGSSDDPHPLTYLLVSNEGRDPLSELLDRETALTLDTGLDAHSSLAAAYVYLLRHFDNCMVSVADHLLISRSHAYRCCDQARRMAAQLQHIPVPTPNEKPMPGPWRRFRLRRAPVQLSFDFDEELPL